MYALLAGTWSDAHGRKTLLFLSVLGQLLASVSYGINYWFLTQISWHFLYLELINDICGTYVSYYIAEYSFITDITEPSQRTFRLAFIDGMDYVSTSIGTKISAPLFISVGYFGVFGVSASVCVLALLYLMVFVKESLHSRTSDQSSSTPLTSTSTPQYGSQGSDQTSQDESAAKTNFVKTSLKFCVESFRTVFRARDGYRRHIVLLGVFNFMCYIFTYNGTEGTHRYTFAKAKYKEWSEQEMSSYLFNYRIAYLVSLWFVIPIFTKIFKLSDNIIGVIACLTSATGLIVINN